MKQGIPFVAPSSHLLKSPAIANFLKSYRQEPIPNISKLDLEEEVSQIDMDPKKIMQEGDALAIKAVIKDVTPVGYFVSLPSGRDGYFPADDMGFTGGLAILQRLFKEVKRFMCGLCVVEEQVVRLCPSRNLSSLLPVSNRRLLRACAFTLNRRRRIR
ncbi:hypothetical protein L7F22_035832 [Adiantum nelumboides]|nr:hypothetical protein [Adiantum nelumboides]